MMNIDNIIEMLDWNQPEEIQKKGRDLAKNVKSINVFIQPYYEGKSKSLWDNCALILSEKSDEDLELYLGRLLEWIMDLNWPGALIIFQRLKKMNSEFFNMVLDKRIDVAKRLDDEIWLSNLLDLKNHKE